MSTTFQVYQGDVITSSTNGRPILLTDRPKISQDIQEFLTVNIQPNGFGAGLEQLIGIVEVSKDVFVSLADKQMSDGLATFIALQRADPRIPRSNLELVSNLTNLQVESDNTDPTLFYFRINIITESGVQIPLVQPIVGQS